MRDFPSAATPAWQDQISGPSDVFRGSPFEHDTTVPLVPPRTLKHTPATAAVPLEDLLRGALDLLSPPGLANLKLDITLPDPTQLELDPNS